MKAYLARHLQVFLSTIGQLVHRPWSTLMTALMLGITLAMPTGLYVLLDGLERISGGWRYNARISVYVGRDAGAEDLARLIRKIEKLPPVQAVEYQSPEQALEFFQQRSGMSQILEALDENPLPHTIVITPAASMVSEKNLQALLSDLRDMQGIEHARLDLQWLLRLQAMFRLAVRAVIVISILLAVAVVLIISNTIRLEIFARKDEIEIVNRVGGSHGFIRRPFLYTGSIQGLLGSFLAIVLVYLGIFMVDGPVQELAGLYGSAIDPIHFPLKLVLLVIAIGVGLGWLASRITVGRHLNALLPFE